MAVDLSMWLLAPYFFPEGGLTAIPRTMRIRIRTRLVALLFACNLIPLISILHLFHRISLKYSDPALAIQQLRPVMFTNPFMAPQLLFVKPITQTLGLSFRNPGWPLQGGPFQTVENI